MPTGTPDAVAVLLREETAAFTPERLAIRRDDLRLLHHVGHVKRTTFHEIEAALRWPASGLRRTIAGLVRAGLLREARGSVQIQRLGDIFRARKIIAVEAKISDWQRGLLQAVANTWFASHSYILLPERRLPVLLTEQAERFGIGVVTFDGERTRTRVRAETRSLPASYGSWLIHESALRIAHKPEK